MEKSKSCTKCSLEYSLNLHQQSKLGIYSCWDLNELKIILIAQFISSELSISKKNKMPKFENQNPDESLNNLKKQPWGILKKIDFLMTLFEISI